MVGWDTGRTRGQLADLLELRLEGTTPIAEVAGSPSYRLGSARPSRTELSAILFPLARAGGRVPRCNATAMPATSKTAISAGARRKSPAHRTGDR
jgi:hypothetical protein